MSQNLLFFLKLLFSLIFVIIGCYSAYFVCEMKSIVHAGKLETTGVAIGLGIFSGFCILGAAYLISNLKNK